MILTDAKFYSSKNSFDESLQIRTKKHRRFVFCIGHRSLMCVPGIGKKNKQLLNKVGISDLTSLYSKYRSINNNQLFKQWLQHEVGFTSYQAKMTTCGIGSKLGEIKETYRGLIPIYCSLKEKQEEKYHLLNNGKINKRYKIIKSTDEKNNEELLKALTKKQIESETILINSYDDQIGKFSLQFFFYFIFTFFSATTKNIKKICNY